MAESILGLVKEAGWVVALLVLAISNAGKIGAFVERLLGRVWPDIARAGEARAQERADQGEHRRLGNSHAFMELIELYQRELAEEKVERRQAQSQVFGVMERHRVQMTTLVRQYEKFNANSIEVLHELSVMIRENRDRLDVIQGTLVGQPSYSDGDTYPTGADAAPGAASPE